jgi:hypothetical protein
MIAALIRTTASQIRSIGLTFVWIRSFTVIAEIAMAPSW